MIGYLIVAVVALIGGGILGYLYGASVERRAQKALATASSSVGQFGKKV